jgi:hypothetical protein
MNKRRRRPLRRRLKTQPDDSERRRDSGRALIKSVAPGALLALGVAAAIGVGAFFLFNSRRTPSKNAGNTQIVAAATSPALPVENESQTGPVPANLDAAQSETSLAEDSTHLASPLPDPISTVSPLPQPTTLASDNKAPDLKLTEEERKDVERERRKAERKRSRLEALYQKHEISSEAYKKGQDEYKSEMAKYRSAIDGAGSANE